MNVGWSTSTGGPLPVPVSIVTGGSAGGASQIQVESTAGVSTNVGFKAGDLYIPVVGQSSTQVIGHVILDSGAIAALTDGSQVTQITGTPTVILSTSTASIGRVIVDTLPTLILSTSTAAIGNITSIVNPVVLSTSTAAIGEVTNAVLTDVWNSVTHILGVEDPVLQNAYDAVNQRLAVYLSGSSTGSGLALESGGNLDTVVTRLTTLLGLLVSMGSTDTSVQGPLMMGDVSETKPVWDSNTIEPLSLRNDGRLRVYQDEISWLRRNQETDSLYEHPDRQYSRDGKTNAAYAATRVYSR